MTVTINGREYGLHFGCTSVELFYKDAGVLSSTSLFNTKLFAKVVWAGLQNEAERQDTEISLTYPDVYEWVEGQLFKPEGQILLTDIAAAFQASQAVKDFAKAGEDVKKKKNGSTLKKSGPSLTAL